MTELNEVNKLKDSLRILIKNLGVLDKEKGCCCGLTYTQYCTVVEIGKAQEIVLKDLAEKLYLDKSTISRTVDSLVKMNLAMLQTLPKNRRYIKITLTQDGQDLFSRMEKGSEEYYKKVLDSIPKDKVPQVIESIDLLLNAVKEHNCCE